MTDNLPEIRGDSAGAVRASANEARTALMRRQLAGDAELAAAKAELERKRQEMEAAFRQQAAELEAQIAPIRAELAKIQEVIHTVDLYLGRNEEMRLLRDGEPAPASEPIVVRQRVLAADEESLALVEHGGVDARRMDAFLGWVAASMENTERLLPEPRCVVAVVPTRQLRDYGDPWFQNAMAEANGLTHWLFRNGERLWVMTTDFVAGQVILPRRDEFADLFAETDWRGQRTGNTLVPGSDKWLRAEAAAGARKRHYLKIGMVLQGVIDRTDCFQPLPEGGVNLLSVGAQDAGLVRMVNELDLALADGREPFRDWQRRLNAQLQVGMRIVGAFDSDIHGFGSHYVNGDRWTRGYHPRLHPSNAEYPTSGEIYPIEGRNQRGEFVIRYQRTEQIEKRNVPVPGKPGYVYPWSMETPKNRASCVVRAADQWILPYDLATIDDLTYYLNHREERSNYLSMVPVIRAALEAKQAERDAEAPFRTLLAGTIAADHDLDLDEVERLLPEVVDRWKLGNKHHRALTGDGAHEAKALKGVRAEFAATVNAKTASGNDHAKALAAARKVFGDRLIALLGKRDGTFLAVADSASTGTEFNIGGSLIDIHDPFGPGWVDILPVTKTGKVGEVARWTTVPARTLSRCTVAWAHDDWATWVMPDPTVRLTVPEIAEGVWKLRTRARTDHPDRILVAVVAQRANGYEGTRPSRKLSAVLHTPGAYARWPQGIAVQWKREKDGLICWTQQGRTSLQTQHGSVTVDGQEWKGDGDFPWVDQSREGGLTVPRLVWIDTDAFRAWMADTETEMANQSATRAAADAEAAVHRSWHKVFVATFTEWLDAKLLAAFLDEYGPNAHDLWEAHRKRINTDRFWRAANARVSMLDFRSVAGKTVAEVNQGQAMPDEVADYCYPEIEVPAPGDN